MTRIDQLRREAEDQEKRVGEALEAIEVARKNWRKELEIAIEKWKTYERASEIEEEKHN